MGETVPHLQMLVELGFVKHSEITLDSNDVVFSGATGAADSCAQHLYAWVEFRGDECQVMYVGRAGKGVAKRQKEHLGGFQDGFDSNGKQRGSSSGRRHAERFREGIKLGYKYEVYAVPAGYVTLHGHEVSLSWSEEQALIRKFKSPWNSENNI